MSQTRPKPAVSAGSVHDVLRDHVLVDGFDFVLDTAKSSPRRLVDARTGTEYLDLFTFFASNPIGMNHPALVGDQDFKARLLETALNKPSNSDVYTTQLAAFVETFQRVMGDEALPHEFHISGGALAVENALKVAFDWKRRRNAAAGRNDKLGTKVLHLRRAFHGRSGYTLSLTNTKPGKTALFPTFEWPRIPTALPRYPESDFLARTERLEATSLARARQAFAEHEHDIAATIVEPIQCEGGDIHLRPEFLQQLQAITHDNDGLFIVDEVQTGMGVTGHPWAHQALGLQPDALAFGKKAQVCGVLAGRRVDEEPNNVFNVPSRINSTWGGNLVDMVRSERILRVIEDENLIAGAGTTGDWFLGHLRDTFAHLDGTVTNLRGRGLLIAFDLPSAKMRNDAIATLRRDEQLFVLGCGTRSLRLRPHLACEQEDLAEAATRMDRVITTLAAATN